ncbi:MAG: hypothetical protein Q8M07_08720 [Prosthecobacter sp.]|nr:hypothetical protein [Prosthecobacter sp.]
MNCSRFLSAFVLFSFVLHHSARAHVADESSLRMKIEPHRLETRLTFNLFTLTRFVKIDSDGDTKISMAELTAAQPGIVDYLNRHVLLLINQQKTQLGTQAGFEWLWPNAMKSPPMTELEYALRNADVTFVHEFNDRPVENLWITFGIFEQTGPLQTIRGLFEQEGQVTEMPFSAQEPDFLYVTSYADDPFLKMKEEDAKAAAAPSGQRWWLLPALVLMALLVLGRKAVTGRLRARQ